MPEDLDDCLPLVGAGATVRDAIAVIDRFGKGIVLVVDGDGRLEATITDGDIRRAMLADLDLDVEIAAILEEKRRRGQGAPVAASVETSPSDLLVLMERHAVRQVPLLDSTGRVVGLSLLDDLVKEQEAPFSAVVMAGGFGTRLGALTVDIPKPMLPVGDRPLLEHIIGQLRSAGIRRVNLTTHYRADVISAHFGGGDDFGVDIQYVNEETPLGTAGALSLLEHGEEPILVMNGDIVTRVDFAAMRRFHVEHRADMTVALRPYEIRVPYGVVETARELVVDVHEKPVSRSFVNAGIYLLTAEACRSVPSETRFDMTDLIRRLIADKRRVVGFPLREYWLDIGTVQDYEQALSDAVEG